MSGNLVEGDFVMNCSRTIVICSGNLDSTDLGRFLKVSTHIKHSIHVKIEFSAGTRENEVVPFTSCKFPSVVVRGVKIGMYNGGGGHMYTWWISVISLDAQLPTIGGVDTVIIMPILCIIHSCLDPCR